jgi:hypothetical protein
MQRSIWICAFLAIAASHCFADDSCTFKPGSKTITIDLRKGSKGFEPACQPLRIRVSDKTPVTLIIRNLSPIEICTVSSKAPTVTTVTNPLESIINTVTGFKSFSLETSTAQVQTTATSMQPMMHTYSQKFASLAVGPDQTELTKFNSLATEVYQLAPEVARKQLTWQQTYQTGLTAISDFASKDFRGNKWSQFDPDKDPTLQPIKQQALVGQPKSHDSLHRVYSDEPPSEIDYAQIQADIDQMKTIQTLFANRCSSTPPGPTACDVDTNDYLTSTLDQASAMLLVLQDNLKTLQTAQSALATSYVALQKMQHDFIVRKERKLVLENTDDDIIYQTISLPFDYGATDTGTISCSTDSAPAVATTDVINYTILYQNVPALTVSTGLMITFLQKNIYGTAAQFDGPTSITSTNPNGTYTEYFRITDSARASVFPMAFVNYKIGSPTLKTWWGEPNNEMIFTNNVSAGIGVNSNTGTNQPEFFAGYAAGFSRVLFHVGAHFGRVEHLGGSFTVNTPVPATFTSSTPVPINWSYQTFIGVGLSVRIAPW